MLPEPFADRLVERQADLAPAERRVAEYLAVAGPEAALLSAAELAVRIGTSDATVVRTAKALGYRGLGELRWALAAVSTNPPLADRLRRTLDHAPADELLASAVSDHVATLDALTRNVTPDAFGRAVDILAASRRIVWRGVGPSAYLAGYGALLAERIGASSRALVHVGTSFADELLTLARGDAVVILAYGRPQVDVRVLVERAHDLELPVVLITDTLGPRFADDVAVVLTSGRGRPGLFASHGVTLVLIEALVLAVAATDRPAAETSLTTLNQLRAELAGRRIDVDVS
jgi:DNA-binding MurR/RpiR family transcriptional regulator